MDLQAPFVPNQCGETSLLPQSSWGPSEECPHLEILGQSVLLERGEYQRDEANYCVKVKEQITTKIRTNFVHKIFMQQY